jgi:antitoxin component YwqK of YwqJK toxin-antitoxin module
MDKQALNLINLYNEKAERHGYWEEYHSNGQLWRKGNFVNGFEDGYWEWYNDNGQLMYKRNYINSVLEKPVTELSMDEIAEKFGIPVEQLKIKK